MGLFKIIFNGEEEDERYDTYEEAQVAADDAVSYFHEGGEILEMSNPGDYPYDPDDEPDVEIVEEES